jgi:hypothetical protein
VSSPSELSSTASSGSFRRLAADQNWNRNKQEGVRQVNGHHRGV